MIAPLHGQHPPALPLCDVAVSQIGLLGFEQPVQLFLQRGFLLDDLAADTAQLGAGLVAEPILLHRRVNALRQRGDVVQFTGIGAEHGTCVYASAKILR